MMQRFICIAVLLSLTGCSSIHCFVDRLNNVARNRCQCGIEAQYAPCGHCSPDGVVTPVVHHEDLPEQLATPEALANEETESLPDSRTEDLEQQLVESKRSEDLAVAKYEQLEAERGKLEARITQLEDDRRAAASRLQHTTERLIATQTQLRDVEVKFARTQASHEAIVQNLESRLASIVTQIANQSE